MTVKRLQNNGAPATQTAPPVLTPRTPPTAPPLDRPRLAPKPGRHGACIKTHVPRPPSLTRSPTLTARPRPRPLDACAVFAQPPARLGGDDRRQIVCRLASAGGSVVGKTGALCMAPVHASRASLSPCLGGGQFWFVGLCQRWRWVLSTLKGGHR